MIAALGQVNLKTGEPLTASLVEPPQPDYATRLCHFLRHKAPREFRGIAQRLQGRYAEHCLDRYFVGEMAGRIVGQVWYGLPRAGTGVGNFGHVYTDPEQRGKGIATALVRLAVADFHRQPHGRCLLCSAGAGAAPIYRQFGFEFISPGASSGPMALINPQTASSFADLEERHFAPGLDTTVRLGHIGDRHDCDRLLDFSRGLRELRPRWHAAFVASQVPTFIDALFAAEDGKGIVTVLASRAGSVLGYAYVLALGSVWEPDLKILDFILHPNYLDQAGRFVRETAALAAAAGTPDIHAFAAACDREKVAALDAGGFREAHRFPGKFRLGPAQHDLLLLRWEQGVASRGNP